MIDILDMHTHTVASGHAYNTIYEMAQSAADKGLELLGIADHGPAMPGPSISATSKCCPGKSTVFGCSSAAN